MPKAPRDMGTQAEVWCDRYCYARVRAKAQYENRKRREAGARSGNAPQAMRVEDTQTYNDFRKMLYTG
jgi:hypothetical protein